MAAYAADPFTYTVQQIPFVGDDSFVARPAVVGIERDNEDTIITFKNDTFAHEGTGSYFAEGVRNYPVNGGGVVELLNPAVPVPPTDHPWLSAIRVRQNSVIYGEYNHPMYAASNSLSVAVAARTNGPGNPAYGWAPFNHAVSEPFGTPWLYDGTVQLTPPYWIATGSQGGGAGYFLGLYNGGTPPLLGQVPDILLGSFVFPQLPADGIQGVVTISYNMGGYEEDPTGVNDPFAWHPLFVQPGQSTIAIDAFIFEGGMDWPWEEPPPTITGRESWGILAA